MRLAPYFQLLLMLTAVMPPAAARAEIDFADDQADRIRVWNSDFYELAFRKADGRLLSIIDKTTGQQVSPGNVHGPWVLKFSDNTWLDGENFSPTNAARRFTYAWNAQTSVLTLQYQSTGSYACLATLTFALTEGPEADTLLTVNNNSLFQIQLLAYPVNLSFKRSEINAVYVPFIEGMRLLPSFFPANDYVARYPGRMFADFAFTDLTSGSLAVFGLQNSQLQVKPATWMILRDNVFAGGVNKYHHDFETAVAAGHQWVSPTTVLSVGASLNQAMTSYWKRSGHDGMPTLSEKLGPALAERLAGAVLLKRDFLQGSWTFNSFQSALAALPAGNLIHIVSFWPRGFDENYPDYFPPNPALGTLAQLQSLTAQARSMGHLVMPYTNPTWWDNESPTVAALGPGIVARDRSSSLIFETYGSHGGYVVSPTSAAVIARQDQTRVEFTQTLPCDFLFEDQIGARDAPSYAANPSTTDPLRYTQALIDVAARSASYLPIMTEGGSDRLSWHETGFCNTLKLGWYAWPSNTFTPYPMAPLWAHQNLYFNCHNLAGAFMAVDAASLTYYVSMGYSLSYDLSAADANWLRMLDVCQKRLLSTVVGSGMASFELLPTAGRTRTTFGNGTTVVANLTGAAMSADSHVVAANGFLATRDGHVVGGILSTLHGQPLTGTSPHYLFIEHANFRVSIWQPRGDDGMLTFLRPIDWDDANRVRASAFTTGGARVDVPATVTADSVQVNYQAQIAGQSIRQFVVAYCRVGDADCDGSIAAPDWLELSGCLSGPAVNPVEGCVDAFDADGDVDTDMRDVAAFQNAFEAGD